MKEAVLVVVPCTQGVRELDVFAGLSVVVLDDMLQCGFAGVYFRRLYLQAVLEPERRSVYEKRRREYLLRVLAEKSFADGTVFVGTRAADVDLAEFGTVYSVRVSDRGLRTMSRAVYGDPVLLYMEYASVLLAVEEAVDSVIPVTDWDELPLAMVRTFVGRGTVDVVMHQSRQRAILTELLCGDDDAQVWLEDAVYRDGTEKRTFFLADYDYLSFVRPDWRDAAVRLMGKAPSVAAVFRLPWCVVDSASLSNACYRSNIHGFPSVSSRGSSLVEFVRTRLAGSLTAREMIGTWVGGLLCDDLTAVDTIGFLGDQPLVSGSVSAVSVGVVSAKAARVPVEYAWMYEAVAGVSVHAWDGERQLDGKPRVVDAGVDWVSSLPLASLYFDCARDPEMAVSVVQFLSRLHAFGSSVAFVQRLLRHAREVTVDGSTRSNYDELLTPMLPGYSYLTVFSPFTRRAAVRALGCAPGLAIAMAYAAGQSAADGLVSSEQLLADMSRARVFSGDGRSESRAGGLMRLRAGGGPYVVRESGFCYLCMFRPGSRKEIRKKLGKYPSVGQILHRRFRSVHIDGAFDCVRVTQGGYAYVEGANVPVLHFAVGGRGPTLRECVRAAGSLKKCAGGFSGLRVGQSPSVCYGAAWYVAAIVAWTIVGCVLFGVLMMIVYRRCVAGGGSGRGRGGTFTRY